jgi:hypothetical protein
MILECGLGWIDANSTIQRPASLGGYGMTMWAQVSDACHTAARSQKPQWQVLLDKYKAEDVKKWTDEGTGKISPAALNNVDRPLTGDQHATFVKEECGLPHAPVKTLDAADKLHCLGCHAVFSARALLKHTPQCARIPGRGNVSRRHDEAKLRLVNICRENKMPAQAEVRLRTEATAAGAKAEDQYIDIVCGQDAIDITVTRFYEYQLKAKTRTYEATVKKEGLKLRVLAFTPCGRIHRESMHFAGALAKRAGKRFDEFWAPVCVEVIRGTMNGIIETRNRIFSVAQQMRANAIEARASAESLIATTTATAPAPFATAPAPLITSSPAQDTADADALLMDVIAEFNTDCVDVAHVGAAAAAADDDE